MRMFDFVLFDADNTLFDYDKAERFALESALTDFGGAFAPEVHDTYREINASFWDRFEKGEVSVNELRLGRFAAFADAVGISADPASLSARYLEYLGAAGFLIDGAVEVVSELAARGYTLGLITNGLSTVQRGRLARSPLADSFVSITISDEIGAKKPDAAIFDHAFTASGNPPKDRSIIVGDSLTSDIAGGRSYGIATCWYNPHGIEPSADVAPLLSKGEAPHFAIGSLGELLGVL